MKYIFYTILFIIVFASCKTVKLNLGKECKDLEKSLIEFASKIEPQGDSCNLFRFDTDSMKYYDYRLIHGRDVFFDPKIWESLYWEKQLTNEYEKLSKISEFCLQKITKKQIIKLFGKNYQYSKIENRLYYFICNQKFTSIVIQFNNEDKLKYLLISL